MSVGVCGGVGAEVNMEVVVELEMVVMVMVKMAMMGNNRNFCPCEFYQNKECRRRVGLGPGWNGAE